VLQLTHISALPRTMSQLQALQKLDVGGNQLQYSDVEFIIESFPQLIELAIYNLGLTGRFSLFAKVAPVDLAYIGGSLFLHAHEELPATIGNLKALTYVNVGSNRLSGTCLVEPVLRLTHMVHGSSRLSILYRTAESKGLRCLRRR
jgi:hypothetical protein